MLRYADVLTDSVVDGPGIRVVVFLQGCPRYCPDCHNPSLLDVDGGKEISERQLAKIILKKLTDNHGGLTISGGDPILQQENLCEALAFIKKRKPDLNVWMYTGYLFEEVNHHPVLEYIDVIVDGPFEKDLKGLDLVYRGSRNQRLIDVQQSLKEGKTVELQVDKTGHVFADNSFMMQGEVAKSCL